MLPSGTFHYVLQLPVTQAVGRFIAFYTRRLFSNQDYNYFRRHSFRKQRRPSFKRHNGGPKQL